jgi:hypothetical protein
VRSYVGSFAAAAAFLTIVSCQKGEIDAELTQTVEQPVVVQAPSHPLLPKYEPQKFNAQAEVFAKTLAQAAKDPSFATLIYQQAMRQFDGDYDVLYKDFKHLVLPSGQTVEQTLRAIQSDFDQYVNLFPAFQLAVPVNCQTWDPLNQPPLVAVAPQGVSEDDVEWLTAFNSTGQASRLSGKVEPNVPVVVVGLSERTDAEGNLLPGFEAPVDYSLSFGRVDYTQERMNRIYVENPQQIESWWLGALEHVLDF